MISSMYTAISGIQAGVKKLDWTAHNIANVSTDGFKYYRVTTEESHPYGTRPLTQRLNTPASQYVNEYGDTVEFSNVDLVSEMVNLMTAEHTVKVNVRSLRAQDEMIQSLLQIGR